MSGIPVYTQTSTAEAKSEGITSDGASIPTPTTTVTHTPSTSSAAHRYTPAKSDANISPTFLQPAATSTENGPPPYVATFQIIVIQ